jgi:CSLREA domain-containing protein
MKTIMASALLTLLLISRPATGTLVAGTFSYMAADTTFTVIADDDLDDGTCDAVHCSLREAINAANGNAGTDTIAFSIAGTGTHTIQPAAPLPTITDAVVIDGTTEPDFRFGPVVELDGLNAGAGTVGIDITAGNSTVRGMSIYRFGDGIRLASNGSNLIEGNIIGADVDLIKCLGNTNTGVLVISSSNQVGGTASGQPNTIVCNGADGIYIGGVSGNVLEGNSIGTDPGGGDDLGNGRDGVRLEEAADNTVGGVAQMNGNLIAFNEAAGISLLGTGATGNTIQENLITANASDGVVLLPTAGVGNAIDANAIFDNGDLGIDLGADGVTANDPGDADTGPNDLQNYPELVFARFGINDVHGSLNSTANTDFELQFFTSPSCNPSNHGEGETIIGLFPITTDANGDVEFTLRTTGNVQFGEHITATVSDPDGNTSEFSNCVPVTDYEIEITPDSAAVTRGNTASYLVKIIPQGGPFNEPVGLECLNLPGLTTCDFAQDSVAPAADTATVRLDITTTLISGSLTGSNRPAAGSGSALLLGLLATGLPGIALLGVAVGARGARRRRGALSVLLGSLVLAALIFTACGDDGTTEPGDSGTPLGRHTVSVVGTSGSLRHQESLILVVR